MIQLADLYRAVKAFRGHEPDSEQKRAIEKAASDGLMIVAGPGSGKTTVLTLFNWKLVREHDGLTNQSKDIMWIEWNEDGTFKEKHDTFAIGRSLLMSPFNQFFTWQTTPITKIITRRPTANIFYVKFETENSVYRLIKL